MIRKHAHTIVATMLTVILLSGVVTVINISSNNNRMHDTIDAYDYGMSRSDDFIYRSAFDARVMLNNMVKESGELINFANGKILNTSRSDLLYCIGTIENEIDKVQVEDYNDKWNVLDTRNELYSLHAVCAERFFALKGSVERWQANRADTDRRDNTRNAEAREADRRDAELVEELESTARELREREAERNRIEERYRRAERERELREREREPNPTAPNSNPSESSTPSSTPPPVVPPTTTDENDNGLIPEFPW